MKLQLCYKICHKITVDNENYSENDTKEIYTDKGKVHRNPCKRQCQELNDF
jgi:hypothetical protein